MKYGYGKRNKATDFLTFKMDIGLMKITISLLAPVRFSCLIVNTDIITKKTDGNIEVVRASNYVRQPPKKFEDPSASQ